MNFLNAIKSLNPKIDGTINLWMNDEVIFCVDSTFGKFFFSKDLYDVVFIIAEDNQSCVTKINELLIMDNAFKNIPVDFNDYKIIVPKK